MDGGQERSREREDMTKNKKIAVAKPSCIKIGWMGKRMPIWLVYIAERGIEVVVATDCVRQRNEEKKCKKNAIQ